MPDLPPRLEALIEQLAANCKHSNPPCQACTDLVVWAVETLHVSGWWAHHYRTKETPR